MKVTAVETIACDAGWRNYFFVKISTDRDVVGWSEYDEGFGSPGVGAVIEQIGRRLVGHDVNAHERFFQEACCLTRPAPGSVIAQAIGALENALLDAKAKGTEGTLQQYLARNVNAPVQTGRNRRAGSEARVVASLGGRDDSGMHR